MFEQNGNIWYDKRITGAQEITLWLRYWGSVHSLWDFKQSKCLSEGCIPACWKILLLL